MDHEAIEAGNLVERYVLGKLPTEEQVRFEEHFARCAACVEQLELAEELHAGLGEVAAEDARLVLGGGLLAVLARRMRWIAPLGIVLLALPALWLAIENRRLRGDLADLRWPLANVPTFLLAVMRDAEAPVPILAVPAEASWLALSIEAEPGVARYHATLEDAGGRIVWQEEALEPNLWDVLVLTMPRALLPPGEYRVAVRATDRVVPGDPAVVYPFRID